MHLHKFAMLLESLKFLSLLIKMKESKITVLKPNQHRGIGVTDVSSHRFDLKNPE